MNKKVIAVVIILLILGIGGYFFMKNGATTLSPQTSTSSAPTSIKELLSKGVSQSCTFSSDGSNGTVYVSGGKVRGDFNSVTEGKTIVSHMIVDGNTSYIWMDGEKTGFKMNFDPNSQPTGETSSPAGSFDASANMNYKCGVWLTDKSVFTLPANVTFTTFAIPTQPTGTTSGNTGSSQCSYCDTLTGDSKAQCLSALNCN